MKFLVDECLGYPISDWLKEEHYDAIYVGELSSGVDDDFILKKALSEKRIVITADKDFGDIIFLHQQPHHGVILLRLKSYKSIQVIKSVLEKVLIDHSSEVVGSFIVATENAVRVVKFN